MPSAIISCTICHQLLFHLPQALAPSATSLCTICHRRIPAIVTDPSSQKQRASHWFNRRQLLRGRHGGVSERALLMARLMPLPTPHRTLRKTPCPHTMIVALGLRKAWVDHELLCSTLDSRFFWGGRGGGGPTALPAADINFCCAGWKMIGRSLQNWCRRLKQTRTTKKSKGLR